MLKSAAWPAAAAIAALAVACGGGGGEEETFVDLTDYPYPVQEVTRLESRDHFPAGQTYDDYSSNPPTSGPHANTIAPEGVSETAVLKEVAVHNMEHAFVIVWYNCTAEPALSNEECATLRNDLGRVVLDEVAAGESVAMTPYVLMDSRIALTAWGYLDTFDEFDEERVRTFIDTFECNFDPEGFC